MHYLPSFRLDYRSPIKVIKNRVEDRAEILYYIDDLKVSVTNIDIAQTVHRIVKMYVSAVGMVVNTKKSAIQLDVETPLPESLRDILILDEVTYKYLGFEMMKGAVASDEMMKRLEERIRDKLEEPTKRVDVFE